MTVQTTAPAQPALQTSAPVGWAAVPRVNLLPPEVIAARSFRKVQRALGVAVLATLLVIAGAWLWAQHGVSSAKGGLDAEQAVTAQLQQEQTKYAQVPQVLMQVEAGQKARQTAMANDVAWYTYLYDLSTVTPNRVWLTSVQASVPLPGGVTAGAGAGSAAAGTAGDSSQINVNPLGAPAVGTVTISGKADTFTDVAAWLDAVDTVEGLDASILDTAVKDAKSTSGSAQYVTFTTHVTVTEAALTHRYDRKGS